MNSIIGYETVSGLLKDSHEHQSDDDQSSKRTGILFVNARCRVWELLYQWSQLSNKHFPMNSSKTSLTSASISFLVERMVTSGMQELEQCYTILERQPPKSDLEEKLLGLLDTIVRILSTLCGDEELIPHPPSCTLSDIRTKNQETYFMGLTARESLKQMRKPVLIGDSSIHTTCTKSGIATLIDVLDFAVSSTLFRRFDINVNSTPTRIPYKKSPLSQSTMRSIIQNIFSMLHVILLWNADFNHTSSKESHHPLGLSVPYESFLSIISERKDLFLGCCHSVLLLGNQKENQGQPDGDNLELNDVLLSNVKQMMEEITLDEEEECLEL